MDAWDPWLAWDRVHGKARQSMEKHGMARRGMAWEWAWARAWQLNKNLAGPEDPAWRSRNTGDGQRGGRAGVREREKENQSV